MKVIVPNSIPIFLSGLASSQGGAQCLPPVVNFDVYYDAPLTVGFHVLGGFPEPPTIEGDYRVGETCSDAPLVAGFYVLPPDPYCTC